MNKSGPEPSVKKASVNSLLRVLSDDEGDSDTIPMPPNNSYAP